MVQFQSHAKKAVCFSPEKRARIADFETSKSPAKLSNFDRNPDIVISRKTRLSAVNPHDVQSQYNTNLATDAVVTLLAVESLAPGQLINTQVEVYHLDDPGSHQTQDGSLPTQDIIVRDSTAYRKMTLYGEDVGSVKDGTCYLMKNLRLKMRNGIFFLNTTKNEKFYHRKIDPIPNLVNITNLSDVTCVTVVVTIIALQNVLWKFLCPCCNKNTSANDIESI